MKKIIILSALATLVSLQAHATCRSAALWAAENEYGNDPHETRVSEVNDHTFKVTVGIGNDEDGAHTYRVSFQDGSCDPRSASVCDLTEPVSDGANCRE
jgi:hypothetical protein